MITTGVAGGSWRAGVTRWGAIEPWDGSSVLDWYVAADDRWHVPSREPAVRQRRLSGTAVVETRLRVPTGDAVHRVYSVADAGGLSIVEVENESTLPIAVAFAGRDVLTDRPVTAIPIEGIELPRSAFVLPVGHRAAVRVAIAHDRSRDGGLPAALPSATQVVNGWRMLTSTASRLDLPDAGRGEALAEAVTAARCEVVLGVRPDRMDDPAGFVVAIGELARIGGVPGIGERHDVAAELAEAVTAFAPAPGWRGGVALDAARRVLAMVGETRAVRDVDRILGRRERAARPATPPDGVWCIPWVEEGLARHGALLPYGLAPGWLGAPFEVFGLPIGPRSRIDYALRWHGERPAVLWDVSGEPVELTAPVLAPRWSTAAPKGEALWPPPTASFS